MTREIKFRFWRKKPSPKMIYPKGDFYIDAANGTAMGIVRSEGKPEKICGLNLILMQFTGLRDKNGKEIYEGDIIETKFYPAYVERIHWKGEPDAICEVYWDLSGFMLKAKGEKDSRFPDMCEINYEQTEIIGNIYESEHLKSKEGEEKKG